MKKNVLVFGAVSGLISVLWFLFAMTFLDFDTHMTWGMYLGYASMFIANIFLVIGVKNYRDKYNGGVITFGKAFKVGILIALVASTVYVLTWLIYYYTSGTDFMEVYAECMKKELVDSGASAAAIAKQDAEMKEFAVMYRNPFFNAAVTYMEILPMGILFTVITAVVMRRKVPKSN
ncbi:DUF4199 domain-containing protein [Fluviicola chungangensis]|uniref:DUF4199 domain-containing protein n=1 Tax=Fluviicola chungangensis TaxID=2597671 RepID=A0A556N6X8_9FLAO|nr:DUF4199 domain-containing protein [Fluviicola chungangensis]TSJ47942.1 DUF4199 domain-containing protein [Fluviicola chungangensis]